MKKLIALSFLVVGLALSPAAFADHHEGDGKEMTKEHKDHDHKGHDHKDSKDCSCKEKCKDDGKSCPDSKDCKDCAKKDCH